MWKTSINRTILKCKSSTGIRTSSAAVSINRTILEYKDLCEPGFSVESTLGTGANVVKLASTLKCVRPFALQKDLPGRI